MTPVVRISAVVAVVVLTAGVCMFLAADFQHESFPHGFKSPVLAMQIARSMEDVKAIVGEPGHSDRSQMRSQQRMDFLFILAYWSEFLLMSSLLWRRGFRGAKYLAAIAGIGATLAAGFDVWENVAILKVLSAPATPDNAPLVQTVRVAAIVKFIMVFVTIIPLAFIFLRRRDCLLSLLGFLFLLTGTIGLIGFGREAILDSTWILELIPLLFLGGQIALVIVFLGFTSRFLQGL